MATEGPTGDGAKAEATKVVEAAEAAEVTEAAETGIECSHCSRPTCRSFSKVGISGGRMACTMPAAVAALAAMAALAKAGAAKGVAAVAVMAVAAEVAVTEMVAMAAEREAAEVVGTVCRRRSLSRCTESAMAWSCEGSVTCTWTWTWTWPVAAAKLVAMAKVGKGAMAQCTPSL